MLKLHFLILIGFLLGLHLLRQRHLRHHRYRLRRRQLLLPMYL
jgi:hypothetical protein